MTDPAAGATAVTTGGVSGQPGRRGELALALAEAIDAVPGARLGGSIMVATQFAGGRVVGVGLSDAEISLHIVASRVPLGPVVDNVRAAAARVLSAAGDARPVAVTVEDLDTDALLDGKS